MLHDISLHDVIPNHDITIRSATALTSARTSGIFSGSKSTGIFETEEISFCTSSALINPSCVAVTTVKSDRFTFLFACARIL